MAAFLPKLSLQRDSLRSLQVAFGPHVKGAGVALRTVTLPFAITEVPGGEGEGCFQFRASSARAPRRMSQCRRPTTPYP